MSLFKWFTTSSKTKNTSNPGNATQLSPAEKDALELKLTIEDAITQMAYIGTDTQFQHTTRLKGIAKLHDLGQRGEKALPTLLHNCFKTNKIENRKSFEAIKAIDKTWHKNSLILLEIPFLIKQLKKDQQIAIKAAGMLQEIGSPAHDALFSQLENSIEPYLQANVIGVLSKMNVEEKYLVEQLNRVLITSKSPSLLETCVDAVSAIDYRNQALLVNLTKLLTVRSVSLITKVITVLEAAGHLMDFAPSVIGCLTDPYTEIRTAAIQALSNHTSAFADDFYIKVIQNQGNISVEELQEIAETKEFWLADKSLFEYRVSSNTSANSLTWHDLFLKNSLNKPIIQLESVLQILVNKHIQHEAIHTSLTELIQTTESQKVQDLAKELLK